MNMMCLNLEDVVHFLCYISSAEGQYVTMKELPIQPIVPYFALVFLQSQMVVRGGRVAALSLPLPALSSISMSK